MSRGRPDLIVPIRDRRQHRRILTLKNFRNALFVLIAVFAAITIAANWRDRHPRSDFGRLYAGRMEQSPPVQKKPEPVQEEPIRDETAADPMLVRAAARSQILLDSGGQAPPPVPAVDAPVPAVDAPVPAGEEPVVHDMSSNVAIVGGPEGVKIVKRDAKRPVLGGGFGRQP